MLWELMTENVPFTGQDGRQGQFLVEQRAYMLGLCRRVGLMVYCSGPQQTTTDHSGLEFVLVRARIRLRAMVRVRVRLRGLGL